MHAHQLLTINPDLERLLTEPAGRDYFTDAELQCSCATCRQARADGDAVGFNADQVDPQFRAHLNRLRETLYGGAIPVNSGFRCLAHPIEARKLQGARERGVEFIPGDHPEGLGVDAGLAGRAAFELMAAAHLYNQLLLALGRPLAFTAISPHQYGPRDGRFVHLGGNPAARGRPRPHTWTYRI